MALPLRPSTIMSNHNRAIVPIEAWCYNALDIRPRRNSIDVGLFAESLVYYDQILLNVGNPDQFAALIHWLRENDGFKDFLALLSDGSVQIYEYSFFTTAIQEKDGSYSIWNVQSEEQKAPHSFMQRYLSQPAIRNVLPGRGNRDRLEAALCNRVIEMKADDCGPPIEAARVDFRDPDRNSLVIQAFIDDLYKVRGMSKPPEVSAVVRDASDDTHKFNISWNVTFDELTSLAGPELNFHPGTPLTAGALCNRLLYSAQMEQCDLYLASPMSVLVGDKLYEATEAMAKTRGLITN